MRALIDGDIVVFRNAAMVGDDSVEYAIAGCYKMLEGIQRALDTDDFVVYIKGTPNFRYDINPTYKAHRKDKVDPQHRQACHDYLIREWGAIEADGIETDDLLGIMQDKVGEDGVYSTAICSIDKDLLQIPGYHYNFVKGTFQTVTELDGIRHFYKQMLIGDVADNLKGVDKIGPVKAGKLIDPLSSEKEMMDVVCKLYNDPDRFQTNADCFWIMRKLNEMWSDRNV